VICKRDAVVVGAEDAVERLQAGQEHAGIQAALAGPRPEQTTDNT
jgi:hypothetical protein